MVKPCLLVIRPIIVLDNTKENTWDFDQNMRFLVQLTTLNASCLRRVILSSKCSCVFFRAGTWKMRWGPEPLAYHAART